MKNIKIAHKLRLLLLVPLLGLLLFSSIISYDKYTNYKNNDTLTRSVELSIIISKLVHELQKERGMTAGFLGSKGANFESELPTQRFTTNEKFEIFTDFLTNLDEEKFSAKYINLIDNAFSYLKKLKSIRVRVSSFGIDGKSAIEYYTNTNSSLIEVVRYASLFSVEGNMTRELIAFTNFLLAKERAGVERAVGAVTFSKNVFLPGMKLKFNRLISEQNAYIDSFKKMSSEDTMRFYIKTLRDDSILEVERMRNIALESGDGKNFGIDSFYWFKTITKKINLLKIVDDKLANTLHIESKKLSDAAKSEMYLLIVVCIFIAILTLITGHIVSKNIRNGVSKIYNKSNCIYV